MRPGILDRRQNRKPRLKLRKSRPGAVGASVVDDDDLVRNFIAAQLRLQFFHGRSDASFFVPRRNDHRKELQVRASASFAVHKAADVSSQRGFASA